ncbi:hypothetical protein [Modestobacter marinus]|uniref:hypothetical protein n=1 Tax=Modestobacter marinus TaxID=477641 RepID=UPI00201A7DDD|nr:hypothetical protein [Modestobacter marinus]
MTGRRRAGLVVAALAAAGLLAGCSGDDGACPDDPGACATTPPSPATTSGTEPSLSAGHLESRTPSVDPSAIPVPSPTPVPGTLVPETLTPPAGRRRGGLPIPVPSGPAD